MINLFDADAGNDGPEITSEVIAKFFTDLDSVKTKNLTVRLCTKGGDQHYMLAIYDAIKQWKGATTIIGTGCVLSSGSFILQAAEKRVLTANCRFMMHYGSGSVDKDFSDVSAIYENVLFSRITEKNPEYKRKELKKLMRDSVYMSAQNAVDLGLADEIL